MKITQWEYHTDSGTHLSLDYLTLNEQGRDGWELVSVIGDKDYYECVYKRPIIKEVEEK